MPKGINIFRAVDNVQLFEMTYTRVKRKELTSFTIKKYRNLDQYGRETVDLIIERETERVKKATKKPEEPREIPGS